MHQATVRVALEQTASGGYGGHDTAAEHNIRVRRAPQQQTQNAKGLSSCVSAESRRVDSCFGTVWTDSRQVCVNHVESKKKLLNTVVKAMDVNSRERASRYARLSFSHTYCTSFVLLNAAMPTGGSVPGAQWK